MMLGSIVVLAAGALIYFGARPAWHPPSTATGPARFTRFALNNASNPVFEPGAAFSARWTFQAPMTLRMSSEAQGAVFAAGMGHGWFGTPIGELYAVDAKTGRLLWQQPANNELMTAPVVAGGMVFVGSGNSYFPASSQARLDTLSSRHIIRGTGPNTVYALNSKTGRLIWHRSTGGENMPSFVYDHGMLLVANGSGYVEAFNARSGRTLWKTPIGSYVSMSSPLVVNGVLIVSGAHPYAVYGINATTGRILWSTALPGAIAGADDSSLAASAHHLFVLSTIGTWTHAETRLYALSPNGHMQWMATMGSGHIPTRIEVGAPVVAGGRVVFASPISQKEYAFSTGSGQKLWATKLPTPVKASVAIVGQSIIVPGVKNLILTMNLATGRITHQLKLPGKFVAFPIVIGHTVYLTSETGALHAISQASLGLP